MTDDHYFIYRNSSISFDQFLLLPLHDNLLFLVILILEQLQLSTHCSPLLFV